MAKLIDIADLSNFLAASPGRQAKIAALARTLQALQGDDISIATHFLSGKLRQGKIGLGYSLISKARQTVTSAQAPTLDLRQTDQAFAAIAEISGRGSASQRTAALGDLFGAATAVEQDFLLRLITEELRQGATEKLIVHAVAKAAQLPLEQVRRAAMVAPSLGQLAQDVLTSGEEALKAFTLQPLHPVAPMLAQPAADVEDALTRIASPILEYKLDGVRIQVHKQGDRVCIYTRNLNDVTAMLPEIEQEILSLPAQAVILDGEAIAFRENGRPYPFQTTMTRFGRKSDVKAMRAKLPLSGWYFDCLHVDGRDLIDLPTTVRQKYLADRLPTLHGVPRTTIADPADAKRFLEQALAAGHEGIMFKDADASYEAGARGHGWLKLKQAPTLDLVILAAEWGNGRRQGKLSNLHLGARTKKEGEFAMVGKTFKGMTDAMLTWQTERLLAIEEERRGVTVFVKPEVVVEVAFNEVQKSSRYPSGAALRFARVKGYREDKTPRDADTIDTIRGFLPD